MWKAIGLRDIRKGKERRGGQEGVKVKLPLRDRTLEEQGDPAINLRRDHY